MWGSSLNWAWSKFTAVSLPGHPWWIHPAVVEGSCSRGGAGDAAAASTILTYFLRQSATHLPPARCCLSFSSPLTSRLPEHWPTLGHYEPEEWSLARAGRHPHRSSIPVNFEFWYDQEGTGHGFRQSTTFREMHISVTGNQFCRNNPK